MTREERIEIGILDELVRLAVGFEDPEDSIADFDQALSKVLFFGQARCPKILTICFAGRIYPRMHREDVFPGNS
jgi:hypothetical protein